MDRNEMLEEHRKGTEQGARLEALKLAAAGREGWEPADVIKQADKYYGYIIDGKDGTEG